MSRATSVALLLVCAALPCQGWAQPAQPTGLNFAAGASGNPPVYSESVSWNMNTETNVTHYLLFVQAYGNTPTILVDQSVPQPATGATVLFVLPATVYGTTYHWQVIAVDSGGCGQSPPAEGPDFNGGGTGGGGGGGGSPYSPPPGTWPADPDGPNQMNGEIGPNAQASYDLKMHRVLIENWSTGAHVYGIGGARAVPGEWLRADGNAAGPASFQVTHVKAYIYAMNVTRGGGWRLVIPFSYYAMPSGSQSWGTYTVDVGRNGFVEVQVGVEYLDGTDSGPSRWTSSLDSPPRMNRAVLRSLLDNPYGIPVNDEICLSSLGLHRSAFEGDMGPLNPVINFADQWCREDLTLRLRELLQLVYQQWEGPHDVGPWLTRIARTSGETHDSFGGGTITIDPNSGTVYTIPNHVYPSWVATTNDPDQWTPPAVAEPTLWSRIFGWTPPTLSPRPLVYTFDVTGLPWLGWSYTFDSSQVFSGSWSSTVADLVPAFRLGLVFCVALGCAVYVIRRLRSVG